MIVIFIKFVINLVKKLNKIILVKNYFNKNLR